MFRKLTVEENLLAILEFTGMPRRQRLSRTRELLGDLELSRLAHQPAYTLSGGERRRLEITRALVSSPSLLLLDEPFSGIDPIAVFEIQEIINRMKDKGIGVLLTDHNVREMLAITNRAYLLADGRVFRSGTARELVRDPDVRRIYLGEKFRADELMGPEEPREAGLLAQELTAGAGGRDKVFAADVDYQLGPKPLDHDVEEIERDLDKRARRRKKRKP